MTWSDSFRGHLERTHCSQQEAAEQLATFPSAVSYWVRGSKPRLAMRKKIEKWSKGAVPAEPKTTKKAKKTGTDG
jgi:predicted transcriptional regulator